MDNKSAYGHLAKWFEYLNDDCGYEQWSQYLIDTLKSYPASVGLDVGCGGGFFTRAFVKEGYQMTGLDISAAMLDFAQEQSFKSGLRAEYILGDISKLKLPKRYHFATAINDCVNYIPKSKLKAAFKNVAAALQKGGVFLFDISSRRKFTYKIANTVSADDREDITYLCFNTVEGDEVTMDVTLFEKQENGSFIRKDERHVQYIYDEEEIVQTLESAGFTLVKVEGHLGEDKTLADRIFFVAQKA